MSGDRHRLRRQLRGLQDAQKAGKPFDRNLIRFEQELKRSVEARAARQRGVPRPRFDADLPISARREEIAEAIRNNQVVVICGETGSGKSTQLPKICLEIGRGVDGLIGHTQPRRIAARSVAARVAEELGVQLGREVGFKIRFTDSTSPQTYIKLMTDGILLAETQNDRFLNQYDTLILDEAHERSLNIDFLLGYLHGLLPKRPELKLIITSATIDAERFSAHFRNAPVIQVSGRTYPVETRYRPFELEEDDDEPDWQRGVARAVDELAALDDGDILIFMPTEREIHETAKLLRGRSIPGDLPNRKTEIVPLYARLSTAEQNRVFQKHDWRRIVIATNVAESSLTVPGIRSVIDPGTARISRYAPRSKVQRLPIEPISQASADQRKGRCGRIAPGVCIRLYSEDDYLSREKFTPPEIQRTNLASVILQLLALNLGDVAEFPFLDPPKPDAIKDGYQTLFELGAVTEDRTLTDLGRRLSKLPVDPRIGRIILAGHEENCLREILIIGSILEIQDPRERPVDKQQQADQAHAPFQHPDSDFLSYLKLWDFYDERDRELSRSKLRQACHQSFLSHNRMREWVDIHRQLLQLVEQAGMKQGPRRDDANAIHRALLAGQLSNVAMKGETNEYTVCGGGKAIIWPGSGTLEKKPKWLVAGEIIETSRRYLRTVARIDPQWIEPLARHLVTRTYSEPHWSGESGTTMAYERVSLFGLVIVPRRRVAYGAIDPAVSRENLIRHGLVEGDMRSRGPFFAHHEMLRLQLSDLHTKSRRPELVIDEEKAFAFFDARIPPDVYDVPRFEKWRQTAEKSDPRLLFLSEADLLPVQAGDVSAADFPDAIPVPSGPLPIEYRFDPGSTADGLTISVPSEALNQLDPHRLGWLVPGLLEEKVTALIKSLPKERRVSFIPIADTARRVVRMLKFGQGSFEEAVATALSQIGPQPVAASLFRTEVLPDYLRMNVRVVDTKGETITAGRDLAQLRREHGTKAAANFTAVALPQWTRDGITAWDFGDLPESVPLVRGGMALTGYPALIDQGQSVSLRLLDARDRALWKTRGGLRRLFYLAARRDLKSHLDWLPNLEKVSLYGATLPQSETDPRPLRQFLGELLVDRAFLHDGFVPRTVAQFDQRLAHGKERLGVAVQDIVQVLEPLLQSLHEARRGLGQSKSPQWTYATADVKEQLRRLIAPGFLVDTQWEWLVQFPRYFDAIRIRLQKLVNAGLARDQKAYAELQPWLVKLRQREEQLKKTDQYDPALVHFRWMLEEYRVSLFAQELRTAVAVSDKRLAKAWESLQSA